MVKKKTTSKQVKRNAKTGKTATKRKYKQKSRINAAPYNNNGRGKKAFPVTMLIQTNT